MSFRDVDTLAFICSLPEQHVKLQLLEQYARQQQELVIELKKEVKELSHHLDLIAKSPSGSTFCITSPRDNDESVLSTDVAATNEMYRFLKIVEISPKSVNRTALYKKPHLF